MFDLSGKTAVVTGAGSGIGEAIAHAFAEHGAVVYVAERDEAGGRRVAEALGERGRFVQLDVSDAGACRACAARVLGERGRCDILVNNAGIGSVGTVLTTNEEDLDRLLRVNVKGIMFMTQALLPSMVERRWGSIVNMASIGGVVGVKDRFAYCTTKFAVVGMTKCVAVDFAGTRVRCNCICPGRVETPWVAQRLAEYP